MTSSRELDPALQEQFGRKDLLALFPGLTGELKSVTLAPPLDDLVTPRTWTLATLLETFPPLRTHLLAVLRKVS